MLKQGLNAAGLALLLGLTAAVSTATPAGAVVAVTPVTYDFSGTITSVDQGFGEISVGESFSGSFTYNSSAPNVGDSFSGVYDALTSLTVTIGGFTATSSGPAELQVGIPGNGAETTDRFSVVSDTSRGLTSNSIDGFTIDSFIIRLDQDAGTLFATDGLPTSLNLADFDSSGVFFDFTDGTDPGGSGSLNSLTLAAVPEPASLALMGVGLAGFGLLRRRRKG